MTLFEHTFYINLASRTDRLAHVVVELAKMDIEGERIDAIKMDNGALGCTMSHIHCLKLAKSRNLPHVFICEDDITFFESIPITRKHRKIREIWHLVGCSHYWWKQWATLFAYL